ncbi:hypothetical protein BFF78_23420 [Streptomyces fodineus]|uniref:YkuD domain-containing protein n=1 Tax=Streptomyces fodineus TaxID=1904616 RepID=A0A1D7YDL5_9ACTN|nr:hypothetical protein [Streptomyces fodineus]AOR33624.1 hypothetical protein BFF78_23420 [Streptomyces fodineus]
MSDELTTGLRDLATANETPPAISAPEIRRRAARRGRRRRTALTLGAGAAALALAVFVPTLNSGGTPAHRQSPAATAPRLPSPTPTPTPTPSSSSPVATPVAGTVDFEKQTLAIGGRIMPITSGSPARVATGPLTVAAKPHLTRDVVGQLSKDACKVTVPFLIELRGTDRTSVYVGPLACAARAGDWIGLGAKDAVWLYNRLKPGDTLSVVTPSA